MSLIGRDHICHISSQTTGSLCPGWWTQLCSWEGGAKPCGWIKIFTRCLTTIRSCTLPRFGVEIKHVNNIEHQQKISNMTFTISDIVFFYSIEIVKPISTNINSINNNQICNRRFSVLPGRHSEEVGIGLRRHPPVPSREKSCDITGYHWISLGWIGCQVLSMIHLDLQCVWKCSNSLWIISDTSW